MSATNRSDVRSDAQQAGDFYRTPAWCVQAILPWLVPALKPPHLLCHEAQTRGIDQILDPGCGDGAIGAALDQTCFGSTSIVGIEQNEALAEKARNTGAYSTVLVCDFLSDYPRKWFHKDLRVLAVGNPPYNQALEFAKQCLAICSHVALLLRIPWAASKERREFHQENRSDIRVLVPRPSFCTSSKCGTKTKRGCGKVWTAPAGERRSCPVCGNAKNTHTDTDATDYAWFLWGFTEGGHWSVLYQDQERSNRVVIQSKDSEECRGSFM